MPEPPDEATTKPGDLWILGNHRLLCGDSASPEDVDRLLAGAAIQLVNTDPPYNVKVEPRSNNAIAAGLDSYLQPRLPPPAAGPGSAPGEVETDQPEDPGEGSAAGQRLRLGRRVRPDAHTPGSATWPASWSPAAGSTSGAAMRTAATIRPC